jgi:hypothetical protein
MRLIVLLLSLIAFSAQCHAAQKLNTRSHDAVSLAQRCRVQVGREEPEATDGKSHLGQLNVQRFSDCMMGMSR